MTVHVTQFADGLPRKAFTVDEVFRFVELGLIEEGERLELLGGDLVPMSPKNIQHEQIKARLNIYLARRSDDDRFEFAPETTFRLSEDTFVEPDFVLYPPDPGLAGLTPETALLAIEVSDTSLAYDRGRKAAIYAAHGVRELWVIDVVSLVLIVHREPSPTGYRDIREHDALATVSAAAIPDLTLRLEDIA